MMRAYMDWLQRGGGGGMGRGLGLQEGDPTNGLGAPTQPGPGVFMQPSQQAALPQQRRPMAPGRGPGSVRRRFRQRPAPALPPAQAAGATGLPRAFPTGPQGMPVQGPGQQPFLTRQSPFPQGVGSMTLSPFGMAQGPMPVHPAMQAPMQMQMQMPHPAEVGAMVAPRYGNLFSSPAPGLVDDPSSQFRQQQGGSAPVPAMAGWGMAQRPASQWGM